VEQGVAPATIIATKYVNDAPAQGVQRTRPLCAYPQQAQYSGRGSIDDAASFVCVKPQNADDD
jgi:feruloyl esterase